MKYTETDWKIPWIASFTLLINFSINPLGATSPNTLYHSLDPLSVQEHLAYYRAYPESEEGRKALEHAWQLLAGDNHTETLAPQLTLDADAILGLVELVQGKPTNNLTDIPNETLAAVEELGASLPNRRLKGYTAKSEAEVLDLPPEEIDLAKGLLLSQLSSTTERRRYEALLDLIALQIRAYLKPAAGPLEKIRAINHFIFHRLHFRFPPQSLYAKDIDIYTFLPSVLDSHEGVCLGVTTLYLCLAQRLDLALEIITPPGHIYIRYRDGDQEVNIETTARGIHIPSEHYLGVNTRSLEQRNIKEVIGMTHFNHASVYWQSGDYEKAFAAYYRALPYSPEHPLLVELMGLCAAAQGNDKEGRLWLERVKDSVADHLVVRSSTVDDYLNGKVDARGIRAIFLPVDDTRETIIKKQQALQEVLSSHPQFRTGLLQLAVTWLQLHRRGEALEVLNRLHHLDPNDPTVQYYLSLLYAQRQFFSPAWEHLQRAEALCASRQHCPRALKELRRGLIRESPEPKKMVLN